MRPSDLPRVLSRDGAARIGLTRSQVRTELRRERWQLLAEGVYLTRTEEPTRDDWAAAGIALTGGRCALSGWDVVRRFGIGSATPPTEDVLILTRTGKNRKVGHIQIRPSARPLGGETFSPLDQYLPGVRHASLARAIADTSLQLGRLAPVRAMVTAAIQRGLATIEQLEDELAHSPRNGSRWLWLALEDVLGGARSIAEAEAVAILRRRRDIPPFDVNASIRDSAGRVIAVADVLWPHLRAILEIDSREFHFSEDDWKRTMARHNALSRLGFVVVHYPPSEFRRRPKAWGDEVAGWLRARAVELSS